MDCNVKVIYLVIGFCFCCKLHVGVDSVEIILYATDVCVSGIINCRNVINVVKITCNLMFVREVC